MSHDTFRYHMRNKNVPYACPNFLPRRLLYETVQGQFITQFDIPYAPRCAGDTLPPYVGFHRRQERVREVSDPCPAYSKHVILVHRQQWNHSEGRPGGGRVLDYLWRKNQVGRGGGGGGLEKRSGYFFFFFFLRLSLYMYCYLLPIDHLYV